MKPDSGRRFIFDGHPVRGQMACLEETLTQVFGRHQYPPAVAELLGEALVAVALLGDTLKFDGSLILQAKGDGALETLMVERDNHGRLRGIARYNEADVLYSGGDLQALVGKAYLAISLLPENGERYQGIVPMDAANLAEVIDGYFEQSEQLPTKLFLTSDGKRAAGLMLQQLPPNAGETPDENYWQHLTALASTVTPDELKNLPAEDLLHRLYHEETVRLFEEKPLEFHCPCSRERSARALTSLGKSDLEALMQELETVSVDCEFCGAKYTYDATDLAWLLADNPAPGSDNLQ